MGDEFNFRVLDARRSIGRIQDELRKQVSAFLEPVEKARGTPSSPDRPTLKVGPYAFIPPGDTRLLRRASRTVAEGRPTHRVRSTPVRTCIRGRAVPVNVTMQSMIDAGVSGGLRREADHRPRLGVRRDPDSYCHAPLSCHAMDEALRRLPRRGSRPPIAPLRPVRRSLVAAASLMRFDDRLFERQTADRVTPRPPGIESGGEDLERMRRARLHG